MGSTLCNPDFEHKRLLLLTEFLILVSSKNYRLCLCLHLSCFPFPFILCHRPLSFMTICVSQHFCLSEDSRLKKTPSLPPSQSLTQSLFDSVAILSRQPVKNPISLHLSIIKSSVRLKQTWTDMLLPPHCLIKRR